MKTLPQRTHARQDAKASARRLARSLLLALSLVSFHASAQALSLSASEEEGTTRLTLSLDHPCQIISVTQQGHNLFCALARDIPFTSFRLPKTLPSMVQALALEEARLRLKLAQGVVCVDLKRHHDSLILTLSRPKNVSAGASETLRPTQPENAKSRLALKVPGLREMRSVQAADTHLMHKAEQGGAAEQAPFASEDLRRALQNVTKLPYSELLQRMAEPQQSSAKQPADTLDRLLSWLSAFVLPEAKAQNLGDSRIVRIAPQDIRARINTAGPESWPEEQSLQTRTDMPDPDATPLPPQPKPLSPEETYLNPNERQAASGSSFISEPLSQETRDEKPMADDPSRPFPRNEAPAAVGPQTQDEGRPFPKNEAPMAVNPADDRPFPNNAKPQAADQGQEKPFPKNETPAVNDSGEAKPFPRNETPAVNDSGEAKPFPKNKTPAVRGAEEPFPKPETPASVKPTKPGQVSEPAQSPKNEQVHGRINTEQPGVIPEAPKEPAAPEQREVIYVDESGNPVEKPLDIKAMMSEMHSLMEQKKYDDALVVLDKLKNAANLDAETLEQVLYAISDCYWYRYEKDPIAGFDVILSTTNEALNFNLRSQRVPDALLRLCLINLSVGNTLDAEGYIMAIVRRYPSYPGTPIGLTALAQAFLKDKRYKEAETFFSLVLDKFPESSQLKDASVGLIDAFYHEKKFDRARLILEFVNKRWPRHYVDNPAFLLLQANIEKEFKQIERQVATLWQLYNLQPSHEQTVPMFLEMADIYLKAGNLPIAEFLYQEILKRAPESEEALTASLRLAEKGFYEAPLSMDVMFALFGRGSKPPFRELYQDLAARSRTNPDAVLCRLKLALWLLWDKQYPQAMGKAADFIDEYPEHADKALAQEIIWKAFEQELAMALSEQNYARILTLWNGFPLVRKRYGVPDSKLRFALAQGQKERGDEQGAMNLMRTFLKSPMDPEYGEIAFLEFFNSYLAQGNWNAILDLGKIVEGWALKPESRQDLDYAMALSAQNLNLQGTALAFWKKIAQNPDAQLYQKAWAMVFIAQDAERRKDIREAYAANLKVVEYFTQLAEERSDKADPERIKNAMLSIMDICEVANHIPEALQWASRFRPYAPENSADYPALRYRESRLYRKLGDTNRSRALLEEIIRHFPDSPYAQAARSELETFQISRDLQSLQSPQPQTTP